MAAGELDKSIARRTVGGMKTFCQPTRDPSMGVGTARVSWRERSVDQSGRKRSMGLIYGASYDRDTTPLESPFKWISSQLGRELPCSTPPPVLSSFALYFTAEISPFLSTDIWMFLSVSVFKINETNSIGANILLSRSLSLFCRWENFDRILKCACGGRESASLSFSQRNG